MEELEEDLKKELAQFVYQHAWSSDCQTSANYTGFHMINVFLEKLQNKLFFKEFAMEVLPVYREGCEKCKSKNTRSYAIYNTTKIKIFCKDCGHEKIKK